MRKKIVSPDSVPENSCVGNEYFDYLWQILLSFGLEDNEVANAK